MFLKRPLRGFLLVLSLLLSCVLHAQTCESAIGNVATALFTHETVFFSKRAEIHGVSEVNGGQRAVDQVLRTMETLEWTEALRPGDRVAVNLSPQNRLHFVSQGLTHYRHREVVERILSNDIELILSQLPRFFRNKYFQIEVLAEGPLQIAYKFAWEVSFSFQSHLNTGFATGTEALVRRYKRDHRLAEEVVRRDILDQQISQETYATCGLSSLVKVMTSRGQEISESELMKMVVDLGIKSEAEYFGPEDPGLSLEQLHRLAVHLGHRFGFSVESRTVEGRSDESYFHKVVERAATGARDEDSYVIANYDSQIIGRPGHGHFSPIGGLHTGTREVLMSEVNLAANPPFWVHFEALIQAMKSTPAERPRGFLVIRWGELSGTSL